MMKSHFETANGPACGRGRVVTDRVRQVTCLRCQLIPAFLKAKEADDINRLQAFYDQAPRTFAEHWHPGRVTMVCSECRTCYGHYENYHCANCEHVEQRLTETGMSF
jgi:hypothetical protein